MARALAGTARVYVVCKGDAYGFDALAVARIAAECGMAALACGDEAGPELAPFAFTRPSLHVPIDRAAWMV